MVIAGFSLQDKLGMVRFSQETFLLVVLGMPFLTLGSADQTYKGFQRELVWGNYTAAEALPTTKRVELFSAKEFAAAALGVDDDLPTFTGASSKGSASSLRHSPRCSRPAQ